MLEFFAESFLPTKFGDFKVVAFRDGKSEHIVLVKELLEDNIPVRIHSKCFTGDTLASLRCDCREQLEAALMYISKNGGMLIYLDQEGRGIGLGNKIKAYALQDEGYDTVDANKKLGFKDDHRNFDVAAEILQYFGISKIQLITNNPLKIKNLEKKGIVVERIPLIISPNKYNKKYIETKKKKLKHLIE